MSTGRKTAIIKDVFGDCYGSGSEMLFHCPKCDHHKRKLSINIEKDVNITLKSIDKQLLGQVAAKMISLRVPDAYKGKGVRKVGAVLKLKEVKKK